MRKIFFITALIVLALLTSRVYAATDLFDVTNTDGNHITINSAGVLSGVKTSYEVFTTGDTLTAAESGKVCILDRTGIAGLPTNGPTFVLPSAAVGLHYTITAGCGNYVTVRPNASDKILYLTLDTGDAIRSSGNTTADSVTLVCGAANKWYVAEMKGTWADYGK